MLVLHSDIRQKQKNMLPFIKPFSIALVFTTAAGILLHDMNIDKAAKIALASPAALATTSAAAFAVAKMDHVHVERASAPKLGHIFNSSLPKFSPPRDDDRRYIQSKKLLLMSGGDDKSYLWPSV
jgi:hypothetical protein